MHEGEERIGLRKEVQAKDALCVMNVETEPYCMAFSLRLKGRGRVLRKRKEASLTLKPEEMHRGERNRSKKESRGYVLAEKTKVLTFSCWENVVTQKRKRRKIPDGSCCD